LKFFWIIGKYSNRIPLNRTMQELKFDFLDVRQGGVSPLNRTMQELGPSV